jgi:outer membrane protein assembly factor BamB
MKDKIIAGAIVLVSLALGYGWMSESSASAPQPELRKPGADISGNIFRSTTQSKLSKPELRKGSGVAADIPGSWPCFRGPNRDGVNTENIPLARSWSASGPPKLWSVSVCQGYAGAAVLGGKVYLLDYDETNLADALRCLSLDDGAEIWRYSYPVCVKPNHGITRTVPAASENYVVAMGPKCHVYCVKAQSGEPLWSLDLAKEFKTAEPAWYAGQCPLLDGEKAILAPGNEALLIAVDCASGKILWKTPNPHNWKMTHASILPAEFGGQKMYVYCGDGGVAGVSAADGKVLWETDGWRVSTATVPTPVDMDGGRIFLTGYYDAGALLLQLKDNGGKISAEPGFHLKSQLFGSYQQTPIFCQDCLYGILPGPDSQLVCLDLKGNQLWSSKEIRFGKQGGGPYLLAQGLLYALDDDGLLTLLEVSKTGCRQLAQAKVLDGVESWGPMALAGGRLLVRDLTHMVCLDVRENR